MSHAYENPQARQIAFDYVYSSKKEKDPPYKALKFRKWTDEGIILWLWLYR